MSATTAPTPFTPRAVLELALCMADGGTAQEAVEVSGIDPVLAKRMLDNWAFIFLLKILPMLIGHRRKSGNRPRTEKERSRIEKAAAPVLRLFGQEQGEGAFSFTRNLRAIRRQQARTRAAAEAQAEVETEARDEVGTPARSRAQTLSEALDDANAHAAEHEKSHVQVPSETRDEPEAHAAAHAQSPVQAPDQTQTRARSKTRPHPRPFFMGPPSRSGMNSHGRHFRTATKGKNVRITHFLTHGAGNARLRLATSVPPGAFYWFFEKCAPARRLNCAQNIHI
ncbi:MAG: hypothetical protein R3C97_08165 [Geminicoccaceae bacterium]